MASAQPGYDSINFNIPADTGSSGNSSELKQVHDAFRNLDRPLFCQCFEDFHVSFSPVLFISEIEGTTNLVSIDKCV